jgi:hypothetical protein
MYSNTATSAYCMYVKLIRLPVQRYHPPFYQHSTTVVNIDRNRFSLASGNGYFIEGLEFSYDTGECLVGKVHGILLHFFA